MVSGHEAGNDKILLYHAFVRVHECILGYRIAGEQKGQGMDQSGALLCNR
jgi:hypothetical protein